MREGGRCFVVPTSGRQGLPKERRGGAAPLPYWGARALARRAADLARSVMGASPAPWRLPGAPFPFWGNGNRDTGLPGAFNNAGDLKPLTYFAPMLGYTHKWSENFRSTLTSGYVYLSNEAAEDPAAYHKTCYESLNLMWQARKKLSVGIECLYGYKVDKSGDYGDLWRVQTGIVYSLF